jgi:1-acyl-sn-glycerol-3-phosphate acyltransferase
VGTFLAVSCILFLLMRGGIVLLFTARFAPRRLMREITYGQRTMARKIFWVARSYGGMRTDFRRERGGRLPPVFMIICNHQSFADIPVLALSLPGNALRFVAKKSLARWVPYVSINLRVGGSALISRTGSFKEGQRRLRRLAELADRGICPAIFPEGTRSRTGAVGDFYAGAVRIVQEERPLPVLSVALDGGYRISRLHQLFLNLRGTEYRSRPLTLYPAPHGKREINEMLEKIQREITEQVEAWREEDARKRKRHP